MISAITYCINNWESLGNEFLKTFKNQHFFLAALKGLRNGVVYVYFRFKSHEKKFRYGAKIRAPHALVMVFLFGEGTWDISFS